MTKIDNQHSNSDLAPLPSGDQAPSPNSTGPLATLGGYLRRFPKLAFTGITYSKLGNFLFFFGLTWLALNLIVRAWDSLPLDIDKINSTVIRILVALGVSAALFIGFNLLFNLPTKSWRSFSAIVGALVGLLSFVILEGNNLLVEVGPRFIFWPLLGLLGGGLLMSLLSYTENPQDRMLFSLAFMGLLGVAQGIGWRDEILPQLDWGVALLTVPIVAAFFALLGLAMRRSLESAYKWSLVGVTVGWLLGAWGGADLGDGTRLEGILVSLIAFLAIGIRLGRTNNYNSRARAKLDLGARKYIFLAPALSFIMLGLLIPLARTAYLSLFLNFRRDGRAASEFGWLENYGFIFTSKDSLDFRGGWDFFTSRLTWWGLAFVIVAAVIMIIRKFTSQEKELRPTAGSISPMVIGWFLLSIAVLSTIRGTLINNLWWVFFVTIVTTSLGLMIAVLTDRARLESVAKSLIFLPMAISFVGASLIWRFLYIARPDIRNQTGVLNSVWIGFGELSVSNSWTVWLASFVLLGICVGLLLFVGMCIQTGTKNAAIGSLLAALVVGFLLYRIIGPGLGGLSYYGSLSVAPLGFLSWLPFDIGWTGLAALILLLLVCMSLLVVTGATIGRGNRTLPSLGALGAGLLGFLLVRPNINNSETRYLVDGEIVADVPDNVLALTEAGERLPQGQQLLEPTADPIFFLATEFPFNNIWLMLVLIWIQTGFAMVIFSAALKSVPTEFIEAAKVDGATETQIFWRVTLPQIATTIGVVVTTLIVLVMKIYDIVKVMTNGNFGTQVLANDMWQRAFTELNFGLGSALAVVLFISVLPIMYYNIRRMQKLGV